MSLAHNKLSKVINSFMINPERFSEVSEIMLDII